MNLMLFLQEPGKLQCDLEAFLYYVMKKGKEGGVGNTYTWLWVKKGLFLWRDNQ